MSWPDLKFMMADCGYDIDKVQRRIDRIVTDASDTITMLRRRCERLERTNKKLRKTAHQAGAKDEK